VLALCWREQIQDVASSDDEDTDDASFRSAQSLASADSLFSPGVPSRHRA